MLDFSLLDGIKKKNPESLEGSKVIYTNIAKVQLERFQDKIQRAAKAYKAWNNAINKSEKLRTDIIKAAASGSGEKELLLMAIECIYTITGDKAFYNRVKEIIKND